MGLGEVETGDGEKEGATAVACSICLETVTCDGDRSTARLQCGHQFHLGPYQGTIALILFLVS